MPISSCDHGEGGESPKIKLVVRNKHLGLGSSSEMQEDSGGGGEGEEEEAKLPFCTGAKMAEDEGRECLEGDGKLDTGM